MLCPQWRRAARRTPLREVRLWPGEDGRAPTGGDEHVFDVGDLIGRRASELANSFEEIVHAVDVRLAKQPTVGVDRERASGADLAVGDEVLGLAPAAEAVRLELQEHDGWEVLVDHGDVDVAWPDAGGLPELGAQRLGFREPRDVG